MEPVVNVLVDTFPGLSLPPTLCLPFPASSSAVEVLDSIANLLPRNQPRTTRFILTTTSNRPIYACPSTTVADLAQGSAYQPCADTSILPLRLSMPLVGGKGGFGSQLRAAGGRMSSRKKRQNAELATGSARNLDGRRLRTITEAKNLATYLATKPEMDKKEKEERRKRWEQVIDLAEQREADMRAGKGADGRRKGLSDEWVEEKEEIGENVRNAVKMAMAASHNRPKNAEGGAQDDGSSGSGGSAPGSEEDSDAEDAMELDEEGMTRLRFEAEAGDADALWVLQHRLNIPSDLLPKPKQPVRRFAGFDDEEDDSGSDNDIEEQATKGKGKEKVF
ncbi:telomere stability and silencing-domain-containing protein [Exophiala viscosa]|uniref:Telomere stability and silencing-domain-containing protein n=1 Tax=Exophiala viscosa TaxID=2486360 RepID=A0AAN6DTY6_9EURO|nr:telomere stability and silencing-domain-containing protein [Exophiala viscosa]KAI1625688.1 telomere stability and silencing-domain-containing protein [Exophiala viscosa]